jgi:hypothetical protein
MKPSERLAKAEIYLEAWKQSGEHLLTFCNRHWEGSGYSSASNMHSSLRYYGFERNRRDDGTITKPTPNLERRRALLKKYAQK